MAYQIKGGVIINDFRELIGVNTAGINTALYVGENIQLDAGSGIVTATEFVGDGSRLTGVVTVSDSGGTPEFDGDLQLSGGLVVGSGLTVTAGLTSLGGNLELNGNDIEGVGTGNFTDLIVSNETTLGTALSFTAAGAGEFATGIATVAVGADSNDLLTAGAVNTAISDAVGDAGTLDFVDENGTLGQINIGAGETLGIIGTPNEIETTVVGTGNTQLQIGLPDDVTIGGTLDVTGVLRANGNIELQAGDTLGIQTGTGALFGITHVGLSTELEETGSASNTTIPSELAVKTYIDNVRVQVESSSNLRLENEDTQFGVVGLATQALGIDGTANEVTVVGAGQTFTIGLPDAVTIANLTVGTGLSFTGGDATEIATGFTTSLDGVAYVDTELVSAGAVKSYVDAQIAETGGALNFVDADGDAGTVDLSSEVLGFLGTEGEVEVAVSAGTTQVTFGLPDNVDIDNTLVVGTGLTISAGNLDFSDAGLQEITGVTSITASGRIQANDFNSTSDITKKENIVVIPDALEKVEALRGVTFDWKDGSGKSGGIIAQEVQAVLPTLVNEGDHLTVNYNGLVGLLIEAVKELSARVEELEGN